MKGETIGGSWGPWRVECLPEDGARIGRLAFDGQDLLTRAPNQFSAPKGDFGRYETRAVYGYDDCFPTVDPCRHPETGQPLEDHGNLCWLPWEVATSANGLVCTVTDAATGLGFQRAISFDDDLMTWSFSVRNNSAHRYACQHVMHALMPLDSVVSLALPEFTAVYDERSDQPVSLPAADSVAAFLRTVPRGCARMLLLRDIQTPAVTITFAGGLELVIRFPRELFSTLGIWWNRDGYPDEPARRRNECAFEPIPGPGSSLADAYAAGSALAVAPGDTLSWNITWNVTHG